VFVVGFIHARLYGDPVFDAYCMYVACMLLFQLSYTGMGGLFLWPHWAWFNDTAPAQFMLLMIGSGIWFIRQATALQRHSRRVDRAVVGFSLFGLVFPVVYIMFSGPLTYAILNVYGLASVVLSISLCLWTWRKGEHYSGWLLLGFLPIHLSYPFPALRAAGAMADSWATQYAVLIGSAIEIPLLLYILHWRAKDFSENRARMRALDSTDPLTGLTATPVLRLRLRDALRRARRLNHRCAVLLVDLTNHAEIVSRQGREAGDRALVIAASRLSQVVREVDTVCRVSDTRFAVLTEGPQPDEARRLLAQHIVARGLEEVSRLPPDLVLRFRVVTAGAPDGAIELTPEGDVDEQRLMQRMNWALDRLMQEPKKVVHHLDPRSADAGQPAAAPA
jgi:GGDEF domain-containing protein